MEQISLLMSQFEFTTWTYLLADDDGIFSRWPQTGTMTQIGSQQGLHMVALITYKDIR